MASENQYRISKDHGEIMKNFKAAQSESAGVFIWYHVGEVRHQQTGKILRVDLTAKKVSLALDGPPPRLSPNDFCYFKLKEKDAVAKSRVLDNSERALTVDLPTEMVFNENRNQKRYPFRPTDEKFVMMQKASPTKAEQFEKAVRLEVINISRNGFALFVSNTLVKYYMPLDNIQITTLNDIRLPKPIPGKIVHAQEQDRKTNFGTDKGMKIGIQLHEPIPEGIFNEYIQNERPVFLDNERFFKDKIFRDSIHLNMSTATKKIGQNPRISEAFKKLSVRREGDTYLKNHIELLREVSCEIGRALGWVTEPNIEKLIYVSYLHDIRYFDRPYLARIANPKQLELHRSKLTQEDIDIFFEGPVYAAEIARDDDRAAPDTYKILLQHRELPDGKGFPSGLKASQLIPLSCLFMVCHEFVDYVIETPGWTYHEFLKRSENVYKGVYFKKILQVFEKLA